METTGKLFPFLLRHSPLGLLPQNLTIAGSHAKKTSNRRSLFKGNPSNMKELRSRSPNKMGTRPKLTSLQNSRQRRRHARRADRGTEDGLRDLGTTGRQTDIPAFVVATWPVHDDL